MTSTIFSDLPKSVFEVLTDEQIAEIVRKEYSQANDSPKEVITFDEVTPKKRGKDKKPRVIRNSNGKNIPVYEMVLFEDYKRPRVYDKKTHLWPLKHHSSKGFYCPFEVLITIILEYSKGSHAKEIFKKVKSDLRLDTWNGLNTLIYYYRAGALNDSIYEHARSYGYKPESLISRECENIGGK